MEKEREKNPKTEKSRINGDGHRQRGSDRHCSNKNQQTDGTAPPTAQAHIITAASAAHKQPVVCFPCSVHLLFA